MIAHGLPMLPTISWGCPQVPITITTAAVKAKAFQIILLEWNTPVENRPMAEVVAIIIMLVAPVVGIMAPAVTAEREVMKVLSFVMVPMRAGVPHPCLLLVILPGTTGYSWEAEEEAVIKTMVMECPGETGEGSFC